MDTRTVMGSSSPDFKRLDSGDLDEDAPSEDETSSEI